MKFGTYRPNGFKGKSSEIVDEQQQQRLLLLLVFLGLCSEEFKLWNLIQSSDSMQFDK